MKSRRYISIAILMILFIVLISSISNATDLDSIYVWSNNTQILLQHLQNQRIKERGIF